MQNPAVVSSYLVQQGNRAGSRPAKVMKMFCCEVRPLRLPRSFLTRSFLCSRIQAAEAGWEPALSLPSSAARPERARVPVLGTRGSLAKPGPMTLRHGGNTSCVEVRGDDGTLIVLDCGTDAHGLGQALLSEGPRCDGPLMITHTHWDHIQGFPFSAPLFVPGNW
jgi:hypothetical protein